MKIGVKTYNNPEFLKELENKVDFFEVMAIRNNNYDFIKEFSLPIIIHAEHQSFEINNADKNKIDLNQESINFAIKIANSCNAKKIIIHPGTTNNNTSSKEQAINFLKNFNDTRILIENLISSNNSLGYSPNEIEEFMIKTKKRNRKQIYISNKKQIFLDNFNSRFIYILLYYKI